jgi:Protein of unknown function (DUF3455)
MKRQSNCKWIGVLFLALLLTRAGSADAPPRSATPGLPAAIEPPPGLVVLFRARAEGVQIYRCQQRADNADQFDWVFKAPRADLFDDHGQKLGTHSAGPVWVAADGSKVAAKMEKTVPAPDANAIPWLLLKVNRHEGTGMFGKVKYIQRIDTWAGRAPAEGCCVTNVGKEVSVKYQATYLFYGEMP